MTQLSVSMTLKKKRAGTRWKIKFFMHLFLGGWDLESRCAHYLIWYKIQLLYLNLFRPNSQTEAYFAKNISEESFFLSCIRVSQNISSICGFLQYTYSLHYAHFGSWKKSCYVIFSSLGLLNQNNLNLWVHKG